MTNPRFAVVCAYFGILALSGVLALHEDSVPVTSGSAVLIPSTPPPEKDVFESLAMLFKRLLDSIVGGNSS